MERAVADGEGGVLSVFAKGLGAELEGVGLRGGTVEEDPRRRGRGRVQGELESGDGLGEAGEDVIRAEKPVGGEHEEMLAGARVDCEALRSRTADAWVPVGARGRGCACR